MNWHDDWKKAQQELSVASRNDQWWKTLPGERRASMGRKEYRRRCTEARRKVKTADERCRLLLRGRRDAGVAIAA